MPDACLHQPHDQLFRATFFNPDTAAGVLRHHLYATLTALVDWNSLALLPGSFIDARMKASEADLLFSARIGGFDALFYSLWEHQSSAAPLMDPRLLSHMVRIWKRQAQEGGPQTRLAPILPQVLSQDKDRRESSARFHELFTFPQCAREAVKRFFDYVVKANVNRGAFQERVVEQQSDNQTKLAMTLADRSRQEGHLEGHQADRQEGEIYSLRRSLVDVRFAPIFAQIPEGLAETL